MPGIGSRPNDNIVQSHQVANLDDQANDWELVLRESHHRMKNTLTLLGASVRRDFTRAGSRDMSVAVDRFERRIVAFGRLYRLLSNDDDLSTISVEVFFEELCGAIAEAVLEPAGICCEAAIERGTLSASQCHRLVTRYFLCFSKQLSRQRTNPRQISSSGSGPRADDKLTRTRRRT